MSLLQNKSGLIMGVANEKSIATGIASQLKVHGAELGFSYLPDERGKMLQRVNKAVGSLDPIFMEPCDVNNDEQLEEFFGKIRKSRDQLDFLVHSIAFAPLEDIRCDTIDVSRQGFLQAMEASVYSFIRSCHYAKDIIKPGGSIITLSYLGGEKIVKGYNLMGVAKAALESATRYLAADLGKSQIRVNAISAGPIKTLASSAIGKFSTMLQATEKTVPLGRNTNQDEVGKAACYLLSDLASGTTGEILHVDCGAHALAGLTDSV